MISNNKGTLLTALLHTKVQISITSSLTIVYSLVKLICNQNILSFPVYSSQFYKPFKFLTRFTTLQSNFSIYYTIGYSVSLLQYHCHRLSRKYHSGNHMYLPSHCRSHLPNARNMAAALQKSTSRKAAYASLYLSITAK